MKKSAYMCIPVAVVLLGIVAYASWYSFDRHAKIVQREKCNDTLANPPAPVIMRAPDGSMAPVYSVNLCVAVVVPPPLWDLLRGRIVFEDVPERMKVNPYSFTDIVLGRYTFGSADIVPCDQSATTTNCAALVAQNPPPQIQPASTTATIGNFSFELPPEWYVTGFGWEQAGVPGAYNISIPSAGTAIYIFTVVSPLGSINPNAKTLDDYRADYPTSATSTREVLVRDRPTSLVMREEVHILSSEDANVNGIPMLKQRYSVGSWSLDSSGERIFDTSSESNVRDELRYVFFDGKTFVVVTGYQADDYIERIMHSGLYLK